MLRILALFTFVGAVVVSALPFLAFAAGCALVAAGAWLLNPSAGLAVGGVLLAVSALAYARGAE